MVYNPRFLGMRNEERQPGTEEVIHDQGKCELFMCMAPTKAEKVEAILGICCQSTLQRWRKALIKTDYLGGTLRLGRINLVFSVQDNVIPYMQTIYRTFLEAVSSGHLSFPTFTRY